MPRAAASQRKERVTVSLSRDSAAYVRRFSAEAHAHVSTVLESMIENFRRTRELEQMNANITAFYDSLPDSIVQEHAAWGAVGATGLAEMFESEIEPATPEIAHTGR